MKEHIFPHGCQSTIECVQILILQIKVISRFYIIIQVACLEHEFLWAQAVTLTRKQTHTLTLKQQQETAGTIK